MAEKFPFLSEEWIKEARKLRQEVKESAGPLQASIRINQIVEDLPFQEGELRTYVDTSQGFLDIELGELAEPDVTVTIDYATAKALFVDMNPQIAIEAFMTGKIRVTGDLSKLLALQGSVLVSEQGQGVAIKIQDITL